MTHFSDIRKLKICKNVWAWSLEKRIRPWLQKAVIVRARGGVVKMYKSTSAVATLKGALLFWSIA